jgi:glycosyltransferase involved in cell wall biosynthesis
MKVCHIITRLILGGAQENTLLTCEGLAARGHDVTLITGPAIGPEGSLMGRLADAPYHVVTCSTMRRAINPLFDAIAYHSLAKTLAGLAPDIVHTHSSKAGILGRRAATRNTEAKIVHTIHGLAFGPTQSPLKNAFVIAAERRAARHTDAFISVADAMTDQAIKAGFGPSGRFTTIRSGVLTRPFLDIPVLPEPRRGDWDPSGPFASVPGRSGAHVTVTQISRLAKRKGHEFLLTAAAQLRNEPITFRFVGDGALRGWIESEIRRRGLTNVELTGLVDPDAIPGLLATTDILVHCSLREGLARAIPQAMLAARPVISFDVDGAREVVTPDTGILVPPGNVQALVQAVRHLASAPARRAALGRTARDRAAGAFDHDHMVDQIESLYERVINEPPLTDQETYDV